MTKKDITVDDIHETCWRCNGKGYKTDSYYDAGYGTVTEHTDCFACNGTGNELYMCNINNETLINEGE